MIQYRQFCRDRSGTGGLPFSCSQPSYGFFHPGGNAGPGQVDLMSAKSKKKKKKSPVKALLVTILLLLIVAAGAAGVYYVNGLKRWKGVFLPNTTINGIYAEGVSPERIEQEITKDYYTGELTVREKDGKTETIPLTDIIDQVTLETPVADFLSEDDLKYWPLRIREPRNYTDEVSVTFDDEKLRAAVHALNAVSGPDIVAPEDAYFTKTKNGFEVIPEVEGTLLDEDKVYETVRASLYDGTRESDLAEAECYVKPKVLKDDPSFDALNAELDKYRNLVLTMDFVGATETLDYSVLCDCLDFDGKEFTFNDEKLKVYVTSLDIKYRTYQTQRRFVRHDGQTILVGGGSGDTYGFWLNVDNMTQRLHNAIMEFESKDVAPSWITNAMTRGQDNGDIGGTYIEVSIADQKLWFYRGYEQVFETDVVTGTETVEERRTPRGLFCILNQKRDHTMSGNYGSQFCHYFMVFDWTGCALHDAYWRSNFGGDIYMYSGSHGCVNIPPDAMEQLYGMTYTGLPVIIY